MPHSDDDFLNAIAEQPAERTRRLVFADWLDDHDDPRGELIRVEEEMRELPVFSDRFWGLKPRRNELRAKAGADWCARMRYGTECAPVFRHGIPDDWRGCWRLIREFTERWHRIPMGDVGGRQAEVAEAEALLGRTLPPSVREWVAFINDVRPHPNCDLSLLTLNEPRGVPGQAAASLWWSKDSTEGRQGGDSHSGVRFTDFIHPDPPVYTFYEDVNDEYDSDFMPTDGPTAGSVSASALKNVLGRTSGAGGGFAHVWADDELVRVLKDLFPVHVQFERARYFEMDNILAVVRRSALPPAHPEVLSVAISQPSGRDQIPEVLWSLVSDSFNPRGVFAPQ